MMDVHPADTVAIATRFLELILPPTGHYAIAAMNPRGVFKSTEFADTIEDIVDAIFEGDRNGFTVFHACAAVREAVNDPPNTPRNARRFGRTRHNTLGAKSLWLDLDCGPKKKYQTVEAAHTALIAFCKKVGLPLPIIITSGGGLHCYWPLEKTLDPPTWRRYASGLKALCERHGLHVDPSRTTDITSVLRTPGTTNRKYTPPGRPRVSAQCAALPARTVQGVSRRRRDDETKNTRDETKSTRGDHARPRAAAGVPAPTEEG
jgi:hypothetical protein